jgi:hypothetical protein
MEEDDLLGGDLGHDPDLWVQLQRGGRNQAEFNQTGYKGRTLDQGDREQDRFGGEGTTIRAGGSMADNKDNKGAGDTISKAIGINKIGIEGIVVQQKELGLSHLQKV